MILSYVEKNGPVRMGTVGPVAGEIQVALNNLGFTLEVDQDFGPNTQRAVKACQATYKVGSELGTVDAATAKVLDAARPPASTLKIAPWLSTMRAITGTKEAPGAKDNPFIIEMAAEIVRRYPDLRGTVGWYNHDSIPWCGLDMGYVMAVNGIKPPKYALSALAWADWGQKLKTPTPGAVLVYSRTGGGHVTLYESENNTHYYCRGGNQSDSVNVTLIPKSRAIKAIRWPNGCPMPTTGRKFGATGNAVAAGSEA